MDGITGDITQGVTFVGLLWLVFRHEQILRSLRKCPLLVREPPSS